jgi:hypothetical protein
MTHLGPEGEDICLYDAFISYRHLEPDYTVAKELHKLLEQFPIPAPVKKSSGKQRMGKVFRDQEELPTSPDLGSDILDALKASRWLIVVCSPRLPLSRWCLKEIETFIELGRRDRILPLLIEGAPQDSFPDLLRYSEIGGERVEREPLAADIRAESLPLMKKKLRVEKLRLLAPMLGVGFDDLRQRAHARFVRRAATAAISAALALAVFGGVFFYQWTQTRLMESMAASAQTSDLVGKSALYMADGQQMAAMRAAAEALQLSESLGLDSFGAQSALYNALVYFPSDRPYAKLTHGGPVQNAAFSADGAYLATLSNYSTVTIWDTTTTAKAAEITLWEDMANFSDLLSFGIKDQVMLKFTQKNELVVMAIAPDNSRAVADNIYVNKYSLTGELLFSHNTLYYSNQNMRFEVWDEAGLIAVSAMLDVSELREMWEQGADSYLESLESGSEGTRGFAVRELRDYLEDQIKEKVTDFDNESENNLLFIDLETGEFVHAETLLDHPLGVSLSGDRQTLSVLTAEAEISEDGEPRYYVGFIFYDINGARRGEDDLRMGAYVDGDSTFYYLQDSVYIVENRNHIYLWDLRAEEFYDLPDLDPGEGSQAVVVATGPSPGEFLAGYHDRAVWLYRFDGNRVRKVRQLAGFDYMADSFSLLAFNEIEKRTVIYLCNRINDTYERVVGDGESTYYDDFFTLYADWNIYLPSGTGLLAVAYDDSSVCELYATKTGNAEHYSEMLSSRRQFGEAYVDVEGDFVIAEKNSDEGYGFEFCRLEGDKLIADGLAVIPGTAGYSVYDDGPPYHSVLYGKTYGIVVFAENELLYSVYRLDYEKKELVRLFAEPAEYLAAKRINEASFVLHSQPLTGDYAVAAYTPQGEKIGSSPAESPGHSYWNLLGVSPVENLAAWSYLTTDRQAILFGVADLDRGTYDDFGLPAGDVDEAFFSGDGRRVFLFKRTDGIRVISLDEKKEVARFGDPAKTIRVEQAGENLLAAITADNRVEFYDMQSYELLLTSDVLVGNLRSVSYNPASGLILVVTDAVADTYSLASGGRAYGALSFPKAYEPDARVFAYIPAAGDRFLYFTRNSPMNSGETYYCGYYAYPLYSNEELLRFAQ